MRPSAIRSLSACVAQGIMACPASRVTGSADRGAQETAMQAAAAQLADAIVHSKQKEVVVFDFSGPDKKVTVLSERLADT